MSLIFSPLLDIVEEQGFANKNFSFEAKKYLIHCFKTFLENNNRLGDIIYNFSEENNIHVSFTIAYSRRKYLEYPKLDEFQYDLNLICDNEDEKYHEDKDPLVLYRLTEWFLKKALQYFPEDETMIEKDFLQRELLKHKGLFYMFVGVKYDQTENVLCTKYRQKDLLEIANNIFQLKCPKSSTKDRLCDEIKYEIRKMK